MATINGGDGGNVLAGTDADDVIYGHSIADTQPNTGRIVATLVTSGLDAPVFATFAPGDLNGLYIVEKDVGDIVRLDLVTGSRTTFLDIPAGQLMTSGEQGLLSLAFHPNYPTDGRFFVNLVNSSGDVEVRSYSVANPTSPTTVITVGHPTFTNHNGGTVAFGPDGNLYVSIGDGGGGGDPGENAENTSSLLGKVLRLNINSDDFLSDSTKNYAIPAGNPFVNQAGADEIWAYGLRNPWRMSFDSATGDLYIADVGQGAREEIDFQAAGAAGGRNYGWDNKEGSLIFEGPAGPGLVDPIFEYDRSLGQSVTGGYVYHGPAPGLQGAYLFADFLSNRLWSLRQVNGQAVDVIERTDQVFTGGAPLSQIASFGVDGNGALYVVSLSGNIYRLVPSAAAGDGNDTIAAGNGNDFITGGIGYDVIDGGPGGDTLAFGDSFSSYTALTYAGTIVVFTNATAEYDRATNIEQLQFPDLTLAAGTIGVFEPFDYIASHGDLINALGANAQAGFDHYLAFGFAEARVRDSFENFEYLASHGDLIAAFGANPTAAAQHYVAFGFGEGRARDSFANFDYLASYGDLIVAFGANPAAASQHYVTYGFGEGRAADAFDNFDYLASHGDLIVAFGANPLAAAQHYVTYGFGEGRARDSFDNLQYIASYGDLISAFGPNPTAAAQHYVAHGFGEGRARDTFDAAQYLANYADLRAAFGSDVQAATVHFIQYGYFEGRTDNP